MDLLSIIREIESDENKRRKAEHLKRKRVYNDYQREYVLEMLKNEFSAETVREMRTVTSINLCKRIIDEMASIYKRKPEREYGFEPTDAEAESPKEDTVEKIYQDAKADTILKHANQRFKLHQQCALKVLPKNGKIDICVLTPDQYDVIPDPLNPEQALCYIISAFDKLSVDAALRGNEDIQGQNYGSKNETASDGINQTIADQDDSIIERIYIFYFSDQTLKVSKEGYIIEAVANPIGMLPFVDVADVKEFEFWVRRGSGITEFALDFSTVLSDVCNISRLQAYAQPVITAEKLPESVRVGPQHILFLPLDPTRPEVKPSFDFANPNPDLKAALELQDKLISYFLTAQGISPKAISGNADADRFTSGIERLLAMIERFEASQSDIDVFIDVENKLYQLIRAWYNAIYNTDALLPKYKFGAWSMDTELCVKFEGPEVIQTETDKEDSVIKRLDAGLISKAEAIAELRDIPIDQAINIVKDIELENQGILPTNNAVDQSNNLEA